MKKLSFLGLAFCFLLAGWPLQHAGAQGSAGYAKSIKQHRKAYKKAFLSNERSPLDRKGIKDLRFFAPDEAWRVNAEFVRTPEAETFDMATYSGTTKPYVQYGYLRFPYRDTVLTVNVYQSLMTTKMPQYRDHLFVPFKDDTNGEETYGGGRYIDLRIGDIQADKRCVLDFNKAYNPYCAYSGGYQCPIPPRENHLPVSVLAGERGFAGKIK